MELRILRRVLQDVECGRTRLAVRLHIQGRYRSIYPQQNSVNVAGLYCLSPVPRVYFGVHSQVLLPGPVHRFRPH